jgi:hypothetical protein
MSILPCSAALRAKITALSSCWATMPGLTTTPDVGRADHPVHPRRPASTIEASTTSATMPPKLSCRATPARPARRERLGRAVAGPAGLLRRQQQHGAVPRRILQHRQR